MMRIRTWLAMFICKSNQPLNTAEKTKCIGLRVRKVVTLIFLCLFSVNVLSDIKESNIDVAFRFSIAIKAKAEQVWPFLFQIDQWKQSIARLESMKLTGEQENGVVAVYPENSSDKHGLLIKTEKIISNTRYSFSIYSPTGDFIGFATYSLEEESDKTQLTYDVYMHISLSGLSNTQIMTRKKQIVTEMEMRQPNELKNLKKIVEMSI